MPTPRVPRRNRWVRARGEQTADLEASLPSNQHRSNGDIEIPLGALAFAGEILSVRRDAHCS